MTFAALRELAPGFDWSAYFAGIHAPQQEMLNVGQPDFFKAEDRLIAARSLAALKAYVKFHALTIAAPWLSKPFADASFTLASISSRRLSVARSNNLRVGSAAPMPPTARSAKP
jgi:putative endopeptidase